MLGVCVRLDVALDPKYPFTSLSTQHNRIDKSICADINVIRYEFKRCNVSRIILIPSCENLAESSTKIYSPLTTPLQLLLLDGRLSLDFPTAETRDAACPLSYILGSLMRSEYKLKADFKQEYVICDSAYFSSHLLSAIIPTCSRSTVSLSGYFYKVQYQYQPLYTSSTIHYQPHI